MKKSTILPASLLIILLAIVVISFKKPTDELFYYAFGEKIYLDKDPKQLVLRYASSATAQLQFEQLQKNQKKSPIEWKDDRTVVVKPDGQQAIAQMKKEMEVLGDVVSAQVMYKTQNEKIDMAITDEILVRFKKETTKEGILKILAAYKLKMIDDGELFKTLSVPKNLDPLQVANAIQETGLAEFSHPNFYIDILHHQIPNDTYFNTQFNLHNTGQVINDGHVGVNDADIDAPEAWMKTQGSNSIVIAVLDEGVTSAHPDLPNVRQVRLNGSNFSNLALPNNPSPVGDGNHGNACAGIIAATTNNAQGVAGIAPNCRIMPIKILNPAASNANLANAITFAKNNGAHILSNSWGYGSSNPNFVPAIVTAIQDAVTTGRGGLGCIVVFAAGNTANHAAGINGSVTFPGNVAITGVLTVGASDRSDLQANYSPTSNPASASNQIVDIVAPSHRAYPSQIAGETFEIWSMDIPGTPGYNSWHGTPGSLPAVGEILPNFGVNNLSYTGRMGGTSSACPQVAAGAALLLSLNASLTQLQVFNILTSTTDKVGGVVYNAIGFSNEMGFGRLNLHKAVCLAGADLYMKDQTTDTGIEPNPDNVSAYYVSRDIWVRNAMDGGFTHQNPEHGVTNYVYVRVRNRGFLASAGASDLLKVYWAKASTGLSWGYPWLGANNICGSNIVPIGSPIGAPQAIASIPSGSSTIFVFPWAPPKPADYVPCFGTDASHFCLLARIETNPVSPFGMTFPETANLWNNVKNNNNIVWKNISVVDVFPNLVGPIRTSVLVAGSELLRRKFETVNLQFTIPAEDQNENVLEVANVDIDLNNFTERWLKNGGKVKGGEIIKDDNGRTLIRVFNKEVMIYNILVEPKELDNVTAAITPKEFPVGKSFDFDLQLWDNDKTPIGGERFTVTFRKENDKKQKVVSAPNVVTQKLLQVDADPLRQSFNVINNGNELLVSSSTSNNAYQVDLMDANGRILLSKNMINQLRIPITQYSKGMYLLRIVDKTSRKVEVQKVML